MKKRLIAVVCMIACMATMLCGCGSRLDDGTVEGTFSQVFNLQKDCIWYTAYVNAEKREVSKDANVRDIYVMENGTMKHYPLSDWEVTMYEISKMSDKEILEKLSKLHCDDPVTSLEYKGKKLIGHKGNAKECVYEIADYDGGMVEIETEWCLEDGSESAVFTCGDSAYAGFKCYGSLWDHLVKRVDKNSKVDFKTDQF